MWNTEFWETNSRKFKFVIQPNQAHYKKTSNSLVIKTYNSLKKMQKFLEKQKFTNTHKNK